MLTWRQLEKSRGRDQIRPSMEMQIILPEDVSASTSSPPVRHCGDEIQGNLQVVTGGNFDFEIHLSFEGFIRTWIGLGNERDPTTVPPTAEFQFLQEIQKLSSHPSTRNYEGHLCTDKLPFQFVVPHELISARSDIHPDFLKLCPSTKAGLTFWGPTTGTTYRQPMIVYLIRIKRIRTDVAVDLVTKSTPQREIFVMPQAAAAPPLAMESFPREYRPFTAKFLKQNRWSRSLGMLQISALEPSPLNLFSTPRPSTVAKLSLVFIPNYSSYFDIQLWEWTYTVKTYLRIWTFYSAQELDRVPTFIAAKANPNLRLRETKTVAEVRDYDRILWSRSFQSSSLEGEVSEGEGHRWMATLTVPVNTAKTLLPTFLNVLSARRYALVVRLSIKEVHHGALELVLPVQLVYDPLNDTDFGGSGGQWIGTQDDISSSVSGHPYSFLTSEVELESPMRLQDSSPPPYDL